MTDLANESNWVQIHASLREVTYIDGTNQYLPLTDRLLPEMYTGRFIRVLMSYPQAPPSWYLGGRLSLKASSANDATVPTNVRNPVVKRIAVGLNRPFIIDIPDFLTEYKVSFQPPLWFVYENLRIWEYVG